MGLPVLPDIQIKIGQKLPTIPAFDLMNGVNAVGQVFCLCIAVLIANEIIAFDIFGCIIAACGF